MKNLLLLVLCALVSSCATTDFNPPTPNACAVWCASASAQLTKAGVPNKVLSITFEQKLGHETVPFYHRDKRWWNYDPATDMGDGVYGSSYPFKIQPETPLQPLFLGAQVAIRHGQKLKSARFIEP